MANIPMNVDLIYKGMDAFSAIEREVIAREVALEFNFSIEKSRALLAQENTLLRSNIPALDGESLASRLREIGLKVDLVASRKTATGIGAITSAERKECPYCGEQIQRDAQKCRYCREWLTKIDEIPVTRNQVKLPKENPVVQDSSMWADEFMALAVVDEEPKSPPISKANVLASNSSTTIERAVPRPWPRFWARHADYFIMMFVVMIALIMIEPLILKDAALMEVIVVLLWVPIEPIFLSNWGTTPGKWLAGIEISKSSGQYLSYAEALDRSFAVWWKGFGIGFIPTALIAQVLAYRRLLETGSTSWDQNQDYIISYKEIGLPETLGIAFLLLVYFALIVAGTIDKLHG